MRPRSASLDSPAMSDRSIRNPGPIHPWRPTRPRRCGLPPPSARDLRVEVRRPRCRRPARDDCRLDDDAGQPAEARRAGRGPHLLLADRRALDVTAMEGGGNGTPSPTGTGARPPTTAPRSSTRSGGTPWPAPAPPSTRCSAAVWKSAGHEDDRRRRTVAEPPARLLDTLEEYARHVGHADIIRESIDGLVGDYRPTRQQLASLREAPIRSVIYLHGGAT